MNTRLISLGRFTASVLFIFAGLQAAAQDNLDFIEPADNASRPINFAQAVTVNWMLNDNTPVRGPVALTTTLGTVDDAMQLTDDFGVATFLVSSDTPGIATIEATTPTDAIDIQLNFLDPPAGSDLLELVPYEPPKKVPSVIRTNEHGRRYWLAKDRIAARIQPGLMVSDLQGFIDENFVVDRFFISQSLMVLVFDESRRTEPLRKLAEELENLETMHDTEPFEPVRRAGLVATLDRSQQTFMVPDQIIVRFVNEPSPGERDVFMNNYKLSELRQFSTNKRRFIATVDVDHQPKDAIQLATDMSRDSRVANADPNFTPVLRLRSAGAGEPGSRLQWHHRNDGGDATDDADIDTDLAWHFTEGSSSTIIAVADSGFDIDHSDLRENIDPAKLFDLADLDNSDLLPDYLGFKAYAHGTHAAGVAGARGDNNRGYSGSCPQCRLMLIRHEHEPDFMQGIEAINKAQTEDADVLSISWGFIDLESAEEVSAAIQDAVDAGVTVVMAMSNENVDNCDSKDEGDLLDSSAHPSVIAVSGITDYDLRSPGYLQAKGHGTCMDVLAPTRGGANGVHTTSVMIVNGEKKSTYWHDFGGTSAATPLVAGVVGLIKTLDEDLSPLEIQRILQDTADRVDPAHANYSAEFGFSDPLGMPTHGYGRINAFEAVKLVATNQPTDVDVPAGHNRMDLFLRDNVTDWGNTERPSDLKFDSPRSRYEFYRSVDIKIDTDKESPAIDTAAGFRDFAGDSLNSGDSATVYVRVRNRGPDSVPFPTVTLHAAIVDGPLPPLPDDFWAGYPNPPADTSTWQTIGIATPTAVPYSGASIAGCPRDPNVPPCAPDGADVTDPAVIVSFELPALHWDAGSGQRPVLLAVVHHDEFDPVQAKILDNSAFNMVPIVVAYDNNVTLWDPQGKGGGGSAFGFLYLLCFLLIVASKRRLAIRSWTRLQANHFRHIRMNRIATCGNYG